MLELAILGILHESPMHGYELRKQLATKVGAFRAAISYGSLYPTLRRLEAEGCIADGEFAAHPPALRTESPPLTRPPASGVSQITAGGNNRLQTLLAPARARDTDGPPVPQ